MQERSYSISSIALVVVLGLACVSSTWLSYKAYRHSQQVERIQRQSLQVLQHDLKRLGMQVSRLAGGSSIHRGQAESTMMAPDGSWTSPDRPSTLAPAANPELTIGGMREPVKVGPEQPVTPKEISAHRMQLLERNQALHRSDEERYGDALASLYRAAHSREDAKERDSALDQMIEKYPESNATAMTIAERALESALQSSTSEVESYYDMLTGSNDYSSVVTDLGVEALPAIQSYLANEYIQNGNYDAAQSMIDALEQNYSDSLVAVPGPNGQPEWRSVSEVIQELRDQIKSGGDGGTGNGPGGNKPVGRQKNQPKT